MTDDEFEQVLSKATEGDESSMAALVTQYEPEVRMVARALLGAALKPHLDSVDLVQSVHKSLMAGIKDRQYDISSPQKLVALALTIVRRKAAKKWRKLQRQQRLSGTPHASTNLSELLMSLSNRETDPARQTALKDVTQNILDRLDATESELIRLRLTGHSTAEAASQMGVDPDVLRVRLSRLRKRLRDNGLESDVI